tara:strand:+ start:1373 stop:2458 length:1086 start_codon:yes stop_codon:yes gene_type:complete
MAVSRINEAGLNVNQYGNRNVIINGAMKVAQRGTSETGIGASSGYFTVDRYKLQVGATSAGRLTMTQEAITDLPGFANCAKLACTTADTSIAAGELLLFRQILEGQDVQQFAKGTSDAKEFTVSFYVKGNASATYVCELFDGDNSRQISKTFSVTTSWTRVVLTFPADTTGAFADDNGVSLYLQIWLHGGSNYTSGTLNSTSWASNTNANRAVGIDSFFDSTSRTFFITGVQLEVGDTATDFEHRTYADELLRCQRYFNRIGKDDGSNTHLLVGGVEATSTVIMSRACPVSMRAVPTCTIGSGVRAFSASVGVATISSFSSRNSRDIICLSVVVSGSHTLGQAAVLFDSTTDGYLDADAEL